MIDFIKLILLKTLMLLKFKISVTYVCLFKIQEFLFDTKFLIKL